MDISGEAADRVVRISMDGVVYALRFSGEGAKTLAAFIGQAAREENKTSGLMKLKNMLKSDKELKVFILSKEQLGQFQNEAKRFGVTYCVLRDKSGGPDSPVEIMVRADDSAKVQRIFERLKFAEVSAESVEKEVSVKKDGEQKKTPPFLRPDSPSRQSGPTSEKPKGEGKAMTKSNGRESVRVKIVEMRNDRAKELKPAYTIDKAVRKTVGAKKPKGLGRNETR